jgi:hypothetical protein
VHSTILSDGFILISGLRQSAGRQIAYSLHELLARAEEAEVSRTDNEEKGRLRVKNAG